MVPGTATFWRLSTQVDFTKPVRLLGEGWYASELLTSVASLTMITTTSKLVTEQVHFTADGAAVGTAIALKTLAAATNHTDTMLFQSFFDQFDRCYWSERTASLHVAHCRFAPSAGYALYLENLTTPDEGDSFVASNYFAGGTGDTSILVLSTSGINVVNNKFNGPVDFHVDIAPTTNDVGNFLFENNSFEGAAQAMIRLIATTGTIVKSIVTGNQFSGGGSTTHVLVGNRARNTEISGGNSFNATVSTGGVGVDIQAGAEGVTVVGNDFWQILTAIKSDASVKGENIGRNRYAMMNNATLEVTNVYLGGESGVAPSGLGSSKQFEVDRFVQNTSEAAFVNAWQLKGECVVELFLTGIVQGAGNAQKYRKFLVTGDTTVTDLVSLVSVGAAFDLQVTASGGFTVVGIKRATGVGTNVQMQVGMKITGFVRDLSKV